MTTIAVENAPDETLQLWVDLYRSGGCLPGSDSERWARASEVELTRRKRQKALVNYLSNTDTQEMPKAVYIPRDE